MKAIVDEDIPYIRPAIEELMDTVRYMPGQAIGPADVRDADVLVVRTRTHCHQALLQGSQVRFVATATIGYDHLDTDYLSRADIRWTNCPGCNASSVGQYVQNALLAMAQEGLLNLQSTHFAGNAPAEARRGPTVGIVGVGHVGGNVYARLRAMGIRCLLCDPPRAEREGNGDGRFRPLAELEQECDIITFHTPLATSGHWPTHHMADADFFSRLCRRPVIINSSRGAVVDNAALEDAMDAGLVRHAVIDTWEGEPHLRLGLLQRAYIATPHIAGYSADGKANASRQVVEALCQWMGRSYTVQIAPPPLPAHFRPATDATLLALQLYDPRRDSQLLKAHPQHFEQLRNHYPLRREVCDICPKQYKP